MFRHAGVFRSAISGRQVSLLGARQRHPQALVGISPDQAEMIAHSCVAPIARTRMTLTPMNSAVGICFR